MNFFVKAFAGIFFAVLAVAIAAAADTPWEFPSELRLTSGTVLHKVTLVRFDHEAVVIRYTGGVAPIPFAHIDEGQRRQVLAMRDTMAAAKAADLAAPREVTGQVFIRTQGDGAYKFAGFSVYAFPRELLEAIEQEVSVLATARKISSTQEKGLLWVEVTARHTPAGTSAHTDGDGKFTLRLPDSKPVFVFCAANRLLSGKFLEQHLWVVPVEGNELILDSRNER